MPTLLAAFIIQRHGRRWCRNGSTLCASHRQPYLAGGCAYEIVMSIMGIGAT
eukprot:c46506_g1_i1 orf=67-222(+)